MHKRFYHWVKLQRKYRSTQKRLQSTDSTKLKEKLDRLSRRLHRLNRTWRIGVSTVTLAAWLAFVPGGEANAQITPTDIPSIKISGENETDDFGFSVSSAGDINGDGVGDLIIGARFADPNGTSSGKTYVIFGSLDDQDTELDLTDIDGTNGFIIEGLASEDWLSYSISKAGDINGDGVDDLIVSAPFADPNGSESGSIYVIFGVGTVGNTGAVDLTSLDGSDGFRLDGEVASDYSGISISNLGDVNGDGVDDIIIGAPFADPNGSRSGKAYIVFGSTEAFGGVIALGDLDGTNGFSVVGEAVHNYLGMRVSRAGDINDDGIHDILIAATRADANGTNSGKVYVIYGKDEGFDANMAASSLDGTNGFVIYGEVADD